MLLFILLSVQQADGTAAKVATALLMLTGEAALFLPTREPGLLSASVVWFSGLCGLAAMTATPQGFAEVLVLVAAGRMPMAVPIRRRPPNIIVLSILFGGTVWLISDSLVGLLAGLGTLFFAERTVERAELAAERDRAVALLAEVEATRDARTRAAAAEERTRIARDLHDVLAHSLSGLSLQLQAIRSVAAKEGVSPAVTVPINRAADLAREGVSEAKAAMSALREPTTRGIESVAALVERFPGDATVTVTGAPGEVGIAAGSGVYRCVQESLTNATRYATGSTVTVELAWQPNTLRVTIADQGRPVGRAALGVEGTGKGLDGMRERINAVGGTMRAGAHGAGWQVVVSVPAIPSGGRRG